MGKSKSRFTLVEKEDIVAVAFSTPGNVKATGRLYGVQPSNIRYWAKSLQAARNVLSPSTFKKTKTRLSLTPGKPAKHHDSDQGLYEFLQNLREHMVTSTTAKPHRQDVAKWAWEAWGTINTNMILNTWWRVLSFGDEEGADENDDDDDEMVLCESDDEDEILYMDEE